jgi:hypothetical protein
MIFVLVLGGNLRGFGRFTNTISHNVYRISLLILEDLQNSHSQYTVAALKRKFSSGREERLDRSKIGEGVLEARNWGRMGGVRRGEGERMDIRWNTCYYLFTFHQTIFIRFSNF